VLRGCNASFLTTLRFPTEWRLIVETTATRRSFIRLLTVDFSVWSSVDRAACRRNDFSAEHRDRSADGTALSLVDRIRPVMLPVRGRPAGYGSSGIGIRR
jgi:hypothetical protein